jgi:hypothetical protein
MRDFDLAQRARKMRDRAAEFAKLAREAGDPVIHAELQRLALLYEAQAARINRGEDQPSDPGEPQN